MPSRGNRSSPAASTTASRSSTQSSSENRPTSQSDSPQPRSSYRTRRNRRDNSASQCLTPDGWLRTGDAARPDQDGYIWIIGRVADGFVSHGKVVHPGDLERVL